MLLNFGEPGGFDISPWADRVRLVEAKDDAVWDLPVIGEVEAMPAVVIRPDGHVAWAGDLTDPELPRALAAWFGPAASAGELTDATVPSGTARNTLMGSSGPAHARGELRTTSAGFPATKVVGCGETHSRVLASCAASSPDTASRETVARQPTREPLASLTVMVETDPCS